MAAPPATTPATAPPFVLTDVDGAVHRLDVLGAEGPLLLVFVEHDCPTSALTLQALAGAGARMVVVSQGGPAPARRVRELVGRDDVPVLLDAAPHPVSTAYEVMTVPTVVLVRDGRLDDRCEAWDRDRVTDLAASVGADVRGFAKGLPDLKPGCSSRTTFDRAALAGVETADAALADDDGIEEMYRRGWTDGLPTVPPTPSRVSAMLGDRDGETVLGAVPPRDGELTLQRLAACAVLAGCEPRSFPLVVAAAEAVLDPAYNLHGVQNTTHGAAPVLIVNGPVRGELGLNSGSNALGFGTRANVTVARALRLMMCLTGGGTPGGLDQSALGGPHKFGLLIAEREEASPWEPFHVERGLAAGTSAVTAVTAEGPLSVSDHYSPTAEGLAATLSLAVQAAWAPTVYPAPAEILLLVCPEHADTFAADGWSKDDLRSFIARDAVRTAGALRATGSRELSPATLRADDETPMPKLLAPGQLLVVVVGGVAGRFSAVMGPWVGGGVGSMPVTRPVDLSDGRG